MHQQSSVGLGLLQGSYPALTLRLWHCLQVVAAATTGQYQVTRVAHLDVGCSQGNGAPASVSHFCLSPVWNQNTRLGNGAALFPGEVVYLKKNKQTKKTIIDIGLKKYSLENTLF